MKKLNIPVGISDFEKIRNGGFYYIDKSGLITEILDEKAEVTLITRPRRFGKTLGMSMLEINQLVWRKTVSIPRWITDRIAGNAMPDAYEKKNNAAVAAFSQLPIRSVKLHTPDGARLAAKVLTPEKPNGRLLIACHGARRNGQSKATLRV